jgi:Outer membrane protein beta-barrel domain
MKLSRLLICFILLILTKICTAQNGSIVGVDLGMSFSQFPTKSDWDEIDKSGTIKINPLISPLLGVTKEWNIFRHFQIKCGVQYQMSGARNYEYTKYTWPVINDYYETWEKIKIHKFCIPITLGYTFKIDKVRPCIFFGTRLNYILSANEYSKQHTRNEPDTPSIPLDEYSEQNMNLYNSNLVVPTFAQYVHYIPPKRIFNQLCVGVSTAIGQNIKINLSYNLGRNSYTVVTDWGYGTVTETTDLPASDYVLSIEYNFTRHDRKKLF